MKLQEKPKLEYERGERGELFKDACHIFPCGELNFPGARE